MIKPETLTVLFIFAALAIFRILYYFIDWMLQKYITPIRLYLTEITEFSTAELKKKHAVLYRQQLISNLTSMKQVIKTAIILVTIALIAGIGFVIYQNSSYFESYFTAKQQKLELATEQKVDEMLKTIELQRLQNDSIIQVYTTRLDSVVNQLNKIQLENIQLKERNANLNYMVKNLNKIIDTHQMK